MQTAYATELQLQGVVLLAIPLDEPAAAAAGFDEAEIVRRAQGIIAPDGDA